MHDLELAIASGSTWAESEFLAWPASGGGRCPDVVIVWFEDLVERLRWVSQQEEALV